uniref:C-type lectin domain-containing protein n=1 Tax=Anisakis simplex TaxID=6269 RepID=A0A0M3J9K8_ANISI
LATIDSRDLLVALKQSSVFNVRGKERCPEGFEMWNGKCYRFFSEKQGFEEAAETCAQISAYSTLASAEDETTNRFLSSTLLSFNLPSR